MSRVPDRLINFKIYKDGNNVAVADIELPNIEYMTETLSGAGIAGETETPSIGQLSSMTTTLNFRTLYAGMSDFIAPQGTMIDCRGSIQEYDNSTGKIIPAPVKVTMMVLPKSTSLGKFEVASATDTSSELEVTYLKLFVNNSLIAEIDKMNFICNIGGKDYLEEVRDHLGM